MALEAIAFAPGSIAFLPDAIVNATMSIAFAFATSALASMTIVPVAVSIALVDVAIASAPMLSVLVAVSIAFSTGAIVRPAFAIASVQEPIVAAVEAVFIAPVRDGAPAKLTEGAEHAAAHPIGSSETTIAASRK